MHLRTGGRGGQQAGCIVRVPGGRAGYSKDLRWVEFNKGTRYVEIMGVHGDLTKAINTHRQQGAEERSDVTETWD